MSSASAADPDVGGGLGPSLAMDTLEERLFESGVGVVTYKWLSRRENVHVNVAKQWLYKFWRLHESRGVRATMLLAGTTSGGGKDAADDDDDEQKVVLVPAESCVSVESTAFVTVTSKHVYSLHAAGAADGAGAAAAHRCDDTAIFAADLEAVKADPYANRFGGVSNKHIVPRSASALEAVRDVGKPEVEAATAAEQLTNAAAAVKPKPDGAVVGSSSSTGVKAENCDPRAAVTAPKKKAKSGIQSMFAAAAKQNKRQAESKANAKASDDESSASVANAGTTAIKPQVAPKAAISSTMKSAGIANFFSKSTTSAPKPVIEEPKSRSIPEALSPGKENLINQRIEAESSAAAASERGKSSAADARAPPQQPPQPPPRKKRAKSGAANNAAAKKRRRIQVQSDSSADEAEDDAEKEEQLLRLSSPEPDVEVAEAAADQPPLDLASDDEGAAKEIAVETEAKVSRRESSGDDDDVIPATPTTAAEEIGGKRRRRRKVQKIVSKTFADDDGFIVTKKVSEWVEEEVDDVDDEGARDKTKAELVLALKEERRDVGESKRKKTAGKKTNVAVIASSPQKKQQSIMTFFKKK